MQAAQGFLQGAKASPWQSRWVGPAFGMHGSALAYALTCVCGGGGESRSLENVHGAPRGPH
jgi:hypothetical protein